MPRINLLDWRQERRERRRKNFIASLLVSLLAAAGLVYVGLQMVNSTVDAQNARNRYLHQQILVVEQQIRSIKGMEKTKSQLIARMHVIEKLEQSRSRIVHFFDQVANTLPQGIYLTNVTQKGNSTTVDGVADSNGRVSAYLKNLDSSRWFADPSLIVINARQRNGRRVSQFTLEVNNATPQKSEESRTAGARNKGGTAG